MTDEPSANDALKNLRELRAMQKQHGSSDTLLERLAQSIFCKEMLIAILAEPVMNGDCQCEGCALMRELICHELNIEVIPIMVDPETMDRALNTCQ